MNWDARRDCIAPGKASRQTAIVEAAINRSTMQIAPGLDTAAVMLESGQLVDSAAFRERMGWKSARSVWRATAERRVFYVEHESKPYFPLFFAEPNFGRTHMQAVARILGDLPSGSKLQFFLTAKRSLGGKTPLQALAGGAFFHVKDVAAAFAEVATKR